MWRVALLCSVVTLTVACGDVPGAPSANTYDPSLAPEKGDPPPPPLDDGIGSVSLSPVGDRIPAATEIVPQQDCFPSFVFTVQGTYFRNNSERMARIHFVPLLPPGSGSGTIHETITDAGDPRASGTLVLIGTHGQHYEIHLLDYNGTSLLFFDDDASGGTLGTLHAEVMACGERVALAGEFSFAWGGFTFPEP